MKKLKYITAVFMMMLVCSCGNAADNVTESDAGIPSAANDGAEAETVTQKNVSGKKTESSLDFFAMDTFINVKAYGVNSEEAVQAAADRINELERLFSVTDENSDIFRLNRDHSADVSDDTAFVISEALDYCKKTDRALDITIYPVLLEWGFTTSEFRVPSEAEISAALEKTGYENVSLSGNKISLPGEYMVDLGSCAKGYASGEMLKTMSEYGIDSAIVNLGGNVQTLGLKPDGSEWKVGIEDPFDTSELLGYLKVSGKAVITSGGYQRYFTDDDGNIYIHIIDPATGHPAESGLASVTVVGENGLMCDALSTSLFVMGKDRAADYWRNNSDGDFDLVLVTNEGNIFITEGIAESYTNYYRYNAPLEIIKFS